MSRFEAFSFMGFLGKKNLENSSSISLRKKIAKQTFVILVICSKVDAKDYALVSVLEGEVRGSGSTADFI